MHRVADTEDSAFLRSIVSAAALFHTEMDSDYTPLETQRFAAVSGGLDALLGQIAGVRLGPVENSQLIVQDNADRGCEPLALSPQAP